MFYDTLTTTIVAHPRPLLVFAAKGAHTYYFLLSEHLAHAYVNDS